MTLNGHPYFNFDGCAGKQILESQFIIAFYKNKSSSSNFCFRTIKSSDSASSVKKHILSQMSFLFRGYLGR